ncbi:MAG: 30S ribosomal protein S7 [Parcubacteria group bacterium CG_4_10_14_0_8_um_filter_35_7]|nr:MAG: 30S ribosomal protein S7 [Parcubacteria group bacterium CG_4_10_14_0_8_um_filter_35_7]
MRGKPALKRKIAPDPKYDSVIIGKFINYVMKKGKKALTQKIIYDTFDILKEKTSRNPLDVFDEAIKNVSPVLEVKSRRVGGANYQIPIPVRGDRRIALVFRWIIESAKTKKGKPMREKLAEEILDASKGQGGAMKKKENVYRMAQANRAFAHFAW